MNMRSLFVHFCFVVVIYLPCHTQTNWTLHKKGDSYTIWLKDVPNEKVKQFKLEATIEGSFTSMYNILKDVEKMNLWYDKVKSVKLLKKLDENEAYYLLEYDLPFPFEDRIATIRGRMDYSTESGTIHVMTKYQPYDIPKDKQNYLTITKIQSSWDIKKMSDNTLKIIHMGYMDPEGNIPTWVVNDAVTSGPLKTLEALKKRLKAYK